MKTNVKKINKKNIDLDFLFLCEIGMREEKCYIMLVEELKRRGYRADYLMIEDWAYKRYEGNVRVLAYNGAVTTKQIGEIIYSVAGLVEYFVYLRWEQVYPDTNDNTIVYLENELCKTAKTFNFFSWGSRYSNILLNCGIEKERIHQVGPIHFDVYRNKFDSIYKSRDELFEEYNIDINTNVMLFISCYGPFVKDDMSQFDYNALVDLIGEKDTEELINYSVESQTELLKWFDRFLNEDDQWTIIYRPHPTIKETDMLKNFERQHGGKFRVIYKYGIEQWIKTVDLICLVESTTVADVFFAKKPCMVLHPVPVYYTYPNVLFKREKIIDDYSSFKKSLNSPDSLSGLNILENYDFSDVPSYIRWCDALEKIISDEKLMVHWAQDELEEIKGASQIAVNKTKIINRRHFFRKKIKKAFRLFYRYYTSRTNIGKKIQSRMLKEAKDYELQYKIKEIMNQT